MKHLLRAPSPALVISLIALFVALGGTSLAATKVLAAKHKDAKADTSLVKKLAPSLSVKHAKTADSAANATHASSADSATNATNATNAGHATTADSAANATGLAGPLASGRTLTGYVDSAGHVGAGEIAPETSISFQIPLAAAPTLNVIPVGGPSTGACPGTASTPSAAGGNLCIYESQIVGTTGFVLSDGLNPGGVTRFGVFGLLGASGSGDYIARGTWAVTAP
jgi:hypothetical protein